MASIPRRLVEELERRGVDVETYIVDLVVKALNLDPKVSSEVHVELALRYLEEGKNLVDKDPIQASEKLYKAVEEAVKALTILFNLKEVLDIVEKRGRWTVTELERAVRTLSKKLGKWLRESWDTANYLHVRGFHEAKLDSEAVKDRLPDIERIVLETQRIIVESKEGKSYET